MAELTGGKLLVKPPKSDAGKRTVSIPAVLVKELRAHLQEYVRGPADILIFTGARGTHRSGELAFHRQMDCEGQRGRSTRRVDVP